MDLTDDTKKRKTEGLNKEELQVRQEPSKKQKRTTTQEEPREQQKLIIDTDPGIDDACAILLALGSSKFQIIGLTSMFGNVDVGLATENCLKILDLSDNEHAQSIPVLEGAPGPLEIQKRPTPTRIHGRNGLGEVKLEQPTRSPVKKDKDVSENQAVRWIVEQVNKYPNEITILALAPLTNIAQAVQLDQTFPSKLKRLVVMGGAVRVPGNVNKSVEANIWGDPRAAEIVLSTKWSSPVVMVPLDVTTQVRTLPSLLDDFHKSSLKYGNFLKQIHDFYFSWRRSNGQDVDTEGAPTHDPTAVMYLLEPQLFTIASLKVSVVTDEDDSEHVGQTVEVKEDTTDSCDHCGKPLCKLHATIATGTHSKESAEIASQCEVSKKDSDAFVDVCVDVEGELVIQKMKEYFSL